MDGMWERSAATNAAELLTGRKGGVVKVEVEVEEIKPKRWIRNNG